MPEHTVPAADSWRSEHASQDRFGFTSAVTFLVAEILEMLRERRPRNGDNRGQGAVIVGIEGGWGTGKSTFLRLTRKMLDDHQEALAKKGEGGERPLSVSFNAWLSCPEGGGTWAVLSERIAQALYENLKETREKKTGTEVVVATGRKWLGRDRSDAPARHTMKLKLDERLGEATVEIDKRDAWQELAGRISQAVADREWSPALNLFGEAPSKLRGRGLDARTGMFMLVRLMFALQKAFTDAEKALTSTGEVIQKLGEAWRSTTPRPPTESDVFVDQLNWLLAHLGPKVRGAPRLIIEIEDISRLSDKTLGDLLSALAYLERLEETLVFLALDREQADALASRSAKGGERALVRTIHLRQRVPFVRPELRARLLWEWAGDVGVEDSLRSGLSGELLDLWIEHGVRTPRQIKRMLTRLNVAVSSWPVRGRASWERLNQPGAAGRTLVGCILAVSTVQLAEERLIPAPRAGVILSELGAHALLSLPICLWNGLEWPDRFTNEHDLAAAPALRWQVRWAVVLRDLGEQAMASAVVKHTRQTLLEPWRSEARAWMWGTDDPTQLRALADPAERILEQLEPVLSQPGSDHRIRLTTLLSTGLRELSVLREGVADAPTEAEEVADLLLNWFDRDRLMWARTAQGQAVGFALSVLHRQLSLPYEDAARAALGAVVSGDIDELNRFIWPEE